MRRATDRASRSTPALVGLGLGLSLGCLVQYPEPNHCQNLEGDATCAERYAGERPFCSWGTCEPGLAEDGCVAERPATDACYSPCGGGARVDEDSSCLGGTGSSTDDGVSTESSEGPTTTAETADSSESSSTTGPLPCMVNEDCPDAAAPFCEPVSGECVGCDGIDGSDAACAGLDPGAPLCVGGACVQCTAAALEACTGKTPVCDDATNTCVPCTAHNQCGDAACNLFTGACLPADAVVHVGPGQRLTTLNAAIDSFAEGVEGTLVVHQGSYNEAATVDGGRVLAFLANDGDLPLWILAPSSSPQLTVGDATVLMEGIELSGNGSSTHPGVRVDGGRAWLDRGRIVQNTSGGVLAEGGAELVLRNCFVGDGSYGANALTIDGASARVLYTTLGTGFDNFDDVFPLSCANPIDVTVRNSVLVSFDNAAGEIACAMADVTNTASETMIPGMGNAALGDIEADWFIDVTVGLRSSGPLPGGKPAIH
jgi:hypothetical protein